MRILIVLAALILSACGSPTSKDTPSNSSGSKPAPPADAAIQYQVTGLACAVDVTYSNSDGGSSQVSQAPLPWNYSFTIPGAQVSGFFLYVSAQNDCNTNVTITATILKDGTVFKQSSSTGPFVIATASAML